MTRQQQIEAHQANADHFEMMGKGFRAKATNRSDTADCLDDGHEMKLCLTKDASLDNAMAVCCEKQAAFHTAQVKALKIADADSLEKTNGTTISSISRNDAPPDAFGIRAVPRVGSPAMPDKLDKATIDGIAPEFRHLVSGDE